ncbi:MAG: cytochrome P450 [Halobacterium sp.]
MSESVQGVPLAPTPDELPVLGSALAFSRDPYGMYERFREVGDVVRFSMANYDMATVLHPDYVEQMLVDNLESFRKPTTMADLSVLSDGLLLTDGERWRAQRTLLQPMFFRERVEAYADTMGAFAADAAREWAGRDALNVEEATSAYTLRVLGKTLLGVETESHRDAVRAGAEAIRARSAENPVSVQIPAWVPTPSNRRYERGVEQFRAAVDDLVAERRREDGDRGDLLSLLLDAEYDDGTSPDETEIRSQLMTFLFAGHETSATALTWLLYELGRKPAVQGRLQAEVDAVIDGDYATPADLPRLDYTEQVVREGLRRYPPATAVFRETREDAVVGGYRIPEGTFVTVPQFVVHRDPRWWDDPHAFDPDRWAGIDDPPGDRPEYSYFPFGGGPRHCIGMRFALLELKLALATFAANLHVDHDHDDVGLDIAATYQPDTTIRATFEGRYQ